MKSKNLSKTTLNRSVYNRARKYFLLSSKGEINCHFCRYNRGCNLRGKHHSGKFINWKLLNKKRSQWII